MLVLFYFHLYFGIQQQIQESKGKLKGVPMFLFGVKYLFGIRMILFSKLYISRFDGQVRKNKLTKQRRKFWKIHESQMIRLRVHFILGSTQSTSI